MKEKSLLKLKCFYTNKAHFYASGYKNCASVLEMICFEKHKREILKRKTHVTYRDWLVSTYLLSCELNIFTCKILGFYNIVTGGEEEPYLNLNYYLSLRFAEGLSF